MSEIAANDDESSSAEPSHIRGPEPSSPDNNQLLREFRNQWKAELTENAKNNAGNVSAGRNPDASGGSATNKLRKLQHVNTDEEIAEATKLFESGSQLEDLGKVFEAMHLYRKAMQIVPNIEMHVYQSERERLASDEQQRLQQQQQSMGKGASDPPIVETAAPTESSPESEPDLTGVDLIAHFHHRLEQTGTFIQRAQPVAAAAAPSAPLHIGDLPAELLLYILRWVVTAQLDIRSLDHCALVSRGFYLCARDPEIWRRACQRVWGASAALAALPAYGSWRRMFRDKARVHLNGVYISRTGYFRYGENSFQDQFYRPMHLIEYYRYVRFFADGTCYMLTTPDAPAAVVPRLVQQPRQQQRPDLLCGDYRMDEAGNVELRMRRNRAGKAGGGKEVGGGGGFGRRRRASNATIAASAYDADRLQSYRVVYRIRQEQTLGAATPRPSALVWSEYEVFRDVPDGVSVLHNKFELKPALYPALVFSRVGDFHSVAAEPLS